METRLEGLLAAFLLVGSHVLHVTSDLSKKGKSELQLPRWNGNLTVHHYCQNELLYARRVDDCCVFIV